MIVGTKEGATVTDPMKKSWSDVGEGFEALGRLLKERYRTPGEGRTARTEPSAEERAAVREAFDKLVAAAKDFGDRTTDVIHDPAVKAQTKDVARSLNAALSATVDLIGEEVGGLLKRTKGGAASQEPDEDSGPSPTK
jgi:hypothetical protein